MGVWECENGYVTWPHRREHHTHSFPLTVDLQYVLRLSFQAVYVLMQYPFLFSSGAIQPSLSSIFASLQHLLINARQGREGERGGGRGKELQRHTHTFICRN